ncbi:MAG TPA: hypothetical protein VF350_01140 [Candidatus Bathyarchaeia archaeon]
MTSSQLSNASIISYLPTTTTTVSFTITGPNGTAGFSNMTIPKEVILYGTNPVVFIDGQDAVNQGYAQDADNFYVWYTTEFSTHQMKIQFTIPQTTQVASFNPLFAIVIIVPEIILIYTVIAVKRLKRKPEAT